MSLTVTKRSAGQAALLAELLEELRHANVTQTAEWAKLRSHIVNQVLACGLQLFDASGVVTDSFVTPYGSLAIANHGAAGHDITVTSGPPQQSAPGLGKGVALVRAGTFAVVNLTGTEYTLYGTATDRVTVQVFVRPQPPAAGPA